MNIFGLNFSVSMERLWLGSEESLAEYLDLKAKIDALSQNRMSMDYDEEGDSNDPAKIGDYLIAKNGDTAVLSIKGSLVNGYSRIHPFFAGLITSYEAIKAATLRLAADPDVKRVVLDVGSPGGMAVGVQSAGKAIQKLGRHKKVIGHTDSLAASAAYWLISSAQQVSASEMAELGSIGVIAIYPDFTKMLENEGIGINVVKAGKYKGAGSPYVAMTDENLEYLQDRIDKTNNFFLTHVARRRSLKLSDRGQWADAKVFYAGEAKAVGLIDEVSDLSDILGGSTATNQSRGKNMNISEEKLALISAGASPESVLTSEELAAYNESLERAETPAADVDETAGAEAAAAAEAEAEAARLAAEEDSKTKVVDNSKAVAELAKENGKLEAKLEAATDQIAKLTADLAAANASVDSLKTVAQAAVTNLQVALRQPKESKDSPADIVAQFTDLKKLMSDRMPVGRQSSSKADTKELDAKPRASGVPNPLRPR
jgi:signal peptide peptidase SppA